MDLHLHEKNYDNEPHRTERKNKTSKQNKKTLAYVRVDCRPR